MSDYHTAQALQGLRAVLARLRDDGARFRDNPVSAVGLFLEGHGLSDPHALGYPLEVARFLGVPASHLWQVANYTFAHRDTSHDGPYFVYLPCVGRREQADAQARIAEQVGALDRYLPHLHRLTRQLPPTARRMLPAEPECWWASLFHLAVHHPRMFLEASRERWVNVTGPAPHAAGVWRQTFPHPQRVPEHRFHVYGFQPPCEDFVPGVIWSRLDGDVFAATAAAVEALIERLEPPPPAPDMAAVRQRFAELHVEFSALAEAERPFLRRPADTDGLAAGPFGGPHLRLVKVASSFRMPPAAGWCGFPMELAFDTLPLARHHADAEFLFTRGLFTNFGDVSERAGAALPPSAYDGQVLFARPMTDGLPPGVVAGSRVGCSALNPRPAARWVRFVFNSLRANDPDGRSVEVRFLDPTPDPRNPFPDVFGYAALPNGFFTASARAIELAGLLPSTTPPATDADAPSPHTDLDSGADTPPDEGSDPPEGALIPRCDGRLLCSPDCGVVVRGEERFTLPPNPRVVIAYMIAAWEGRPRAFTQRELLDVCESAGGRLRDVFRSGGEMNPAWGGLISQVEGRRGFYELRLE